MSSTDTKAGGHPDLIAKFKLDDPGEPEVAKDIDVNAAAGHLRKPRRDLPLPRRGLRRQPMQPRRPGRAGDTIVANYEGDPNNVLGTAPVYNMEPTGEETARLAFVAPMVNVPITVPITVRSDADYGLQLSNVQRNPAGACPLNFAEFTSGDSRRIRSTTRNGSDPAHRARRPAASESLSTACIARPTRRPAIPVRPFIDNPSVCTGAPLPVTARASTTYQDPSNPSAADSSYPATTGCENQKFDPVFNLEPDHRRRPTPPSGLDIQLKADQFLEGTGAVAVAAALGDPDPARRADDQPRRRRRPDRLHATPRPTSAPRAPAAARTAPRSAPSKSHTPALDGPLIGSLYIGEPQPGQPVPRLHDLRRLRDPREARRRGPPRSRRPGQLTMSVDRPAAGPVRRVRPAPLRLRPRPDGDPDPAARIYRAELDARPLERTARAAGLARRSSASPRGPNGSRCPGQIRPFKPAPRGRAPRTPIAGDFSAFTLKLDRDDGDQFLGDLNFTMPPGFTGDLRGITYCPEASIAAAAQNLGRSEQAAPSCPAASPDRHHQRRRRPRQPSLPRGREDVPRRARSRARRSRWSR